MPSRTFSARNSSIVALCAAGAVAAPALATDWHWNSGNGVWNNPFSWLPGGIPGFDPAATTNIFIGDMPFAQNGTIELNLGALALSFDDMYLSDGMKLDLDGGQMGSLTGETHLQDPGTELIVRPSAGPNFHDFTSNSMVSTFDAALTLVNDARVRAGYLASYGTISGRGTIHIQGGGPGSAFVNNGTIHGSPNGGLIFVQEGAGRFNLNGWYSDAGFSLTTPFSQLTFIGDQPQNAFSGNLQMGSGSLLTMDMSEGWSSNSNADIVVTTSLVGAAAQIDGGHFSLGAHVDVSGSQGHLRILADTTILFGAWIELGLNDVLEFDGETVVDGGWYDLLAGSRIDFDGATEVRDGTFNMAGDTALDGVVNFNGSTEWNGEVEFNGTARQHGQATVIGQTVIDAQTFDLDGEPGSIWWVDQGLIINADRIDTWLALPNRFNGFMDIGGANNARLTINLTDPSDAWWMSGVLQLHGSPLAIIRVDGSPVHVDGYLHVSDGISVVVADATIESVADVAIMDGATLRLSGKTHVEADPDFFGEGVLQNGVGGEMTLDSGVSTNWVGLSNSATLRIVDDGAGQVTVDRFTNAATGNWIVEVGGAVAGTEFDRLDVTGDVTLAGVLSAYRIDGFVPAPGETFTFLTWTGTRTGEFDAIVSCDGATVIYGRNSASIQFTGAISMLGDVNHDGVVNGADLTVILGEWGACDDPCCPADLNDDGKVNGFDLSILLGQWG